MPWSLTSSDPPRRGPRGSSSKRLDFSSRCRRSSPGRGLGAADARGTSSSDPVVAIEYQIVVMLMLVASTASSSSIVVHVLRRTCFTGSSQLSLR
ncbi:MAG TPA: hypothetical protein EYO90_12480 [Candidatus Latescibacteria bacterium]|nr:hypothetical protein [Candidatus Latescibacterota bacterium]